MSIHHMEYWKMQFDKANKEARENTEREICNELLKPNNMKDLIEKLKNNTAAFGCLTEEERGCLISLVKYKCILVLKGRNEWEFIDESIQKIGDVITSNPLEDDKTYKIWHKHQPTQPGFVEYHVTRQKYNGVMCYGFVTDGEEFNTFRPLHYAFSMVGFAGIKYDGDNRWYMMPVIYNGENKPLTWYYEIDKEETVLTIPTKIRFKI